LPRRLALLKLFVMLSSAQSSSLSWRLILDAAAWGARNMAVDEALALALLEEEGARPTLRFYAWDPPCLSLGRLQSAREMQQVLAVRAPGVDWVRRPSGGRGVWHQHEVTYSFSAPLEVLPAHARSVVAAYEWLSRPLLRGLETLGVRATLGATRGESGERNCFLSSSQADAVVDGRKLIGGAQCRFEAKGRTAILQHGSILIEFDPLAWSRALGEDSNADSPSRMSQSALSLRELGVAGSVQQVRSRVQSAIVAALREEAEVEEGALSTRESQLSSELEAGKYLSRAWNERGSA
jgi:lipoate-protein ligase A